MRLTQEQENGRIKLCKLNTNAFGVSRVEVDVCWHRPHQVKTDLFAIAAGNLPQTFTQRRAVCYGAFSYTLYARSRIF